MPSLNNFLKQRKEDLLKGIIESLDELPPTPYLDHLIRSSEGQRRISLWLDLLVQALEGNEQALFDDQKNIGYIRATQGYEFSQTSPFYPTALKTLNKSLIEADRRVTRNYFCDYGRLMEYYLHGYQMISESYIHTREDIIHEKIFHLEELYDFTKEIIITQDIESIIEILLKKIHRLMERGTCYFLVSQNGKGHYVYNQPSGRPLKNVIKLMEKSYSNRSILFESKSGWITNQIQKIKRKTFVAIPVYLRGQSYGVISLVNRKTPFEFTARELHLLNQFLYIAVIALDNALMFRQIEQNHQQLRFLTEKIITIQEEERKQIAVDIHDSLAQTLASIGYKIEFCKEHIHHPEQLSSQLDLLTGIVKNAIFQSRSLMSELRPELIDTIGLMAAIRRLLDDFETKTGIRVHSDLPTRVDVQASASICIYRVLQEALTNISKHSLATTAHVTLRKKGRSISLVVSDNGRGFDLSSGLLKMASQNKLGLVFMKERVEACGGKCAIETMHNKGCRIEISVPLEKRKAS
ncbi:MAG: GAF domain-containing sensor histidine kinase [Syntrophaceae bacterium]|nr:GAF domain-containing sensor histidine kinase [Syntrophaceae bacterium]